MGVGDHGYGDGFLILFHQPADVAQEITRHFGFVSGHIKMIEQNAVDIRELQSFFQNSGKDGVVEDFSEIEGILMGNDPRVVDGFYRFNKSRGKIHERESEFGTGIDGQDSMPAGTGQHGDPSAFHERKPDNFHRVNKVDIILRANDRRLPKTAVNNSVIGGKGGCMGLSDLGGEVTAVGFLDNNRFVRSEGQIEEGSCRA